MTTVPDQADRKPARRRASSRTPTPPTSPPGISRLTRSQGTDAPVRLGHRRRRPRAGPGEAPPSLTTSCLVSDATGTAGQSAGRRTTTARQAVKALESELTELAKSNPEVTIEITWRVVD